MLLKFGLSGTISSDYLLSPQSQTQPEDIGGRQSLFLLHLGNLEITEKAEKLEFIPSIVTNM